MPNLAPPLREIARLAGAADPPPNTLREIADVAREALAVFDLHEAAPDLLVACQDALSFFDDGMPDGRSTPKKTGLIAQLRAAIIKAGG